MSNESSGHKSMKSNPFGSENDCGDPGQSVDSEITDVIDQNASNDSYPSMGSNILRDQLYGIGLDQEQVDCIIENNEKFVGKPCLLSIKLKISEETAVSVLEILKCKKQDKVERLSQEHKNTIEKCIEEHPDLDNTDIAFVCDIDESVVCLYFELKPLSAATKI